MNKAEDIKGEVMKAPMVALGEIIVQRREKNKGYNVPIRGVAREGFIEAKQPDADTSIYNVFYKNDFVFNPARMEINSIALNTEYEMAICSSLYEVFYIKEGVNLMPEFLNLFIKRDEFARQCEYIGSGSAREYCRVSNISQIKIPLPPIETQRKYVDAYNGLKQLAEQNEAMIEPLKNACNAYLSNVRKEYEAVRLGDYIEEYDRRNSDNSIKAVKGISVTKSFREPNAKVNPNELRGYKIVPPMYIAYVQTTNNEKVFTFDLNKFGFSIVVSSVDRVIGVKNNSGLNIEFLNIWFRRSEFDRLARFNSWGSAREVFSFEDLCDTRIPLPPLEVQRSIVSLYQCAEEARSIAAEARKTMREMCPAMVRKSSLPENGADLK